MKKLLVLSLVLAVAGIANAGLSMTYADGQVIVSSDLPIAGGIDAGIAAVQPIVDISGVTLFLRTVGAPAAAPTITRYTAADLAGYGITGFDGGDVYLLWGDATLDVNGNIIPAIAGEWFRFDLPGFLLGNEQNQVLKLVMTDGNVTPMAGVEALYLTTPEPMTMLLLGLGGLFLRKK